MWGRFSYGFMVLLFGEGILWLHWWFSILEFFTCNEEYKTAIQMCSCVEIYEAFLTSVLGWFSRVEICFLLIRICVIHILLLELWNHGVHLHIYSAMFLLFMFYMPHIELCIFTAIEQPFDVHVKPIIYVYNLSTITLSRELILITHTKHMELEMSLSAVFSPVSFDFLNWKSSSASLIKQPWPIFPSLAFLIMKTIEDTNSEAQKLNDTTSFIENVHSTN